MVTGEWLDSWTGVIFLAFFSWPKASAKRARSPRLSPHCVSLAPRFPASFAQKGEQIAPVLHVSEWYPFLTCSKENHFVSKLTLNAAFLMWIKKLVLLLPIISVEKAFAVKRRSESTRPRTQGHTCMYAKLPKTEKNFNFQKYPDTYRRGLASVSQLRRGKKASSSVALNGALANLLRVPQNLFLHWLGKASQVTIHAKSKRICYNLIIKLDRNHEMK